MMSKHNITVHLYIRILLSDPGLFRVLSSEAEPMKRPGYF